MDFGRAISYVRQDPNWLVKVLLGSIISIIPILNFAALGYSLDVIRNVSEGRETPLPEWGNDFGGYFVRGLMFLVIALIYLLPVIILGILFAVVTGGIAAASMDSPDAAGAGIGLAALCITPLIFVAAIVLGLLAQIAQARYATTRDFGAAMRFGEVFAEFRNNIGAWLMVILFSIVLQLIFGLIAGITCGLGFLVSFYATLAQSHLIAQAHRQSAGGMVTEPARL